MLYSDCLDYPPPPRLRETPFYRRGRWARSRLKPGRSGSTLGLSPRIPGSQRAGCMIWDSSCPSWGRRALLMHDEGPCARRLWWVRAWWGGTGNRGGRGQSALPSLVGVTGARSLAPPKPQQTCRSPGRWMESLGRWPPKHSLVHLFKRHSHVRIFHVCHGRSDIGEH